jgi:hypothetical protein
MGGRIWVVKFLPASARAGGGRNSCWGHHTISGPPMASLGLMRPSEMRTQSLEVLIVGICEAGSKLASGMWGINAKLTHRQGLTSEA